MSIDMEDIPESMVSFANLVGYDVFLKICEEYGGCQIYIPSKRMLLKKNRDNLILQEYSGDNIVELSKKYSLTPNQIKYIIKSKKGIE